MITNNIEYPNAQPKKPTLQINRRQSIPSPTTPPTKKKSKPHHPIKSINVKN